MLDIIDECDAPECLLPPQPYRHDPRLVCAMLRAWCDQQPKNSIRRRAVEALLTSQSQKNNSAINARL